MSLGILAVGIIIFAIVGILLGYALRSMTNDFSALAFLIIITICSYCAISGTYFLYSAGKI